MKLDPIEKKLFLEGVHLRYGYDFRQYADASLHRRLTQLLISESNPSLVAILARVLQEPEYFRRILTQLTIGTTEFFRDPEFFKALREQVFPHLKTYPSLRVWIAGCSTGEEIVSLAILLKEEGLLPRTTIYATDINHDSIKRARDSIYPMSSLQTFARNYGIASGLSAPAEYYTSEYGAVRFKPELTENVVFSEHNLVTDEAFTEAHLILCRNVLIYFTRDLQNRVFDLFRRSLAHRAFLGIGSKEAIRFSSSADRFETVNARHNLFRLKGGAA